MINIISNAIKYTPEGKSIDLKAIEEESKEEGKRRYVFTVADTGMGISKEYLPHLFESFTREEKTTVNRVQGTGLGLSISKKIVEMMGGDILVSSKVNEGSTFTVILDLDLCEEELEEELEEEKKVDLGGKKILLVEDNAINAEIAMMVLKQYGIEVVRKENGALGLEELKKDRSYDAVLMDIQMPIMDGYEASKAIRLLEDDYYRKLPIIAMSANAYDEDVARCLASGMNSHIGKPFDPMKLVELLGRYIGE